MSVVVNFFDYAPREPIAICREVVYAQRCCDDRGEKYSAPVIAFPALKNVEPPADCRQ